jgi:16S rRNA U516 pseudouridylate synthase RsuA-like enzyme
VSRLRRVQIGGLTIDDLAPGAWRVVTDAELREAFPAAPFSRKKLPARATRR